MTQLIHKNNWCRRYLPIILAFIGLACLSGEAAAHEFWITPKKPYAVVGTAIRADVNVGQKLAGNPQVYLPSDIASAGYVDSTGRHKLNGVAGDQPVFSISASKPGLSILFYEATAGNIEWNDAARFKKYLRTEGLTNTLSEHVKRGLPEVGFSEDFLRHAKALVVRGAVRGSDRALGLDYEIVLKTPLENLAAGKMVEAQISWKGQPAKDVAINVFAKQGSKLDVQQVRTDQNGLIRFSATGDTFYLLNAVHMVAVNKPDKTVWQSHWASLTFAVGNVESH